MKINKQLFEDILSGKLKGTFVLRDGRKFNSKYCCRNINDHQLSHPYCLRYNNHNLSYKPNGLYKIADGEFEFDIVDFIPDTFAIDLEMYSYNEKDIQFIEHFIKGHYMKENELTIEIPEGKTVDWEASQKQNKIVLKDKQLTYEDICDKLYESNPTFECQFKCLLAKNKLANVAKYLNDEWKPKSGEEYYTLVCDRKNKKIINSCKSLYCDIGDFIFKSHELAQQAIEILGEETVKLALEPLGI